MAKWQRDCLQNSYAPVRFRLPPQMKENTFGKKYSRKYDINEDFFDVWSSKMAYVLGFWFADGYMRIEKSYRILFCSNDKQILESICAAKYQFIKNIFLK